MLQRLTTLFIIIFIAGCATKENVNDVLSLDLAIEWSLETNFVDGGGHKAVFLIRNTSQTTLTPENWELYWNMAPRTINEGSISAPVTIEWINGDFYRMKPKEGFRLAPGEELEIAYVGSDFMIKESDGPLGVYSVLYDSDGNHKTFATDCVIAPFTTADQINRNTGDVEPIPTAEWLYDQNTLITELQVREFSHIVPTPRVFNQTKGRIQIGPETKIYYDDGLEMEANMIALNLNPLLNATLTVVKSDSSGKKSISLKRMNVRTEGSYILDISPDGITISGDKAGVFYGTQSLMAMALVPLKDLDSNSERITFYFVHIEDSPAFGYRGMHLDVARNFNSIRTVKHLIDAMAFYKLNKLHLHLTEDEAWRIEIEELPELTQIGAFRGHTLDDSENLQPSYGSGPSTSTKGVFGSGYYTREQYKNLIRYAWDRHIEIIPEVNIPGHSRAAIKAMEYRYRKLMEAGKEEEANEYRLADPDDTSKYKSAQWYTDNVICVCKPSAFKFFTTVFDDLLEMYNEAGVPLTMMHTGGDEVPRGVWTGSPICQEYMKEHPEVDNPKNLQKEFFKKINTYIAEKGLQTGGWEEIALNFKEDGSWSPNEDFANSNVVPFVWNDLWGAEDLGNKLANSGYPVVLCNVTNFYFDLAYNKDPREPGLYWAGFVDTRDAFEFVPYNVFNSTIVDASGKEYTDADFEGLEPLKKEARKNILGFQAQLWAETIKGRGMLEHYYMPKMLALAERAWYGQADWGEISDRTKRIAATDNAWNRFANTLGKYEFQRLDKLYGGYNYRLAPPGAKVENGKLLINTAYPGMTVRYTTDGTAPTTKSPVYDGPLEVGLETVSLSTFDARGRASLPTVINLK